MEDLGKTIGERIKTVRKEKRLTQAQLAAKLHVTTSLVTQYESGARKPSAEILGQIAQHLNVSLDYLFGSAKVNTRFDNEEIVALFEDYLKLPPRDQAIVRELIMVLVRQQDSEEKTGL